MVQFSYLSSRVGRVNHLWPKCHETESHLTLRIRLVVVVVVIMIMMMVIKAEVKMEAAGS
jgi:hypothetical protein